MSQSQQSLDQQRGEVSQMLKAMDPNASIAATTVFKLKNDDLAAFEGFVADVVRDSLKMAGARVFDFQKRLPLAASPQQTTAQCLIYEKWNTVSAYLEQWNSDHFQKFQAAALGVVLEPPVLTFYSGPQVAHVLKTGQVRCWSESGALVSCSGTGQDGAIGAGVPIPIPRFVDNNNGTITDSLTGLIWLKNTNLYGEVPWDNALANARSLASGVSDLTDGSVAGDWRLPNVNELQSILNLNNSSGPAVSPDHPFINLYPSNYWSSSSVALAPALGWYVALGVGPPVFDLKMNSMRMWPVRGGTIPRIAQTGQNQCFDTFGQPVPCAGTGQDPDIRAGILFPTPRFIENNDGTVSDRLTALTWLQNANAFGTKSWYHALETCNDLASGSAGLKDGSKAGDWRLPNLFELRSLIDYSAHSPALPAGYPFNNVIPSLYWSSTTVASAPNCARFVFVGVGPSVWDHKSVLLHVWPVRGGLPEAMKAS
jgi:quinol monooxygenase YgiN